MTIALIIILLIATVFGSVLFVGAPFLPTMKKQRQDSLDLLGLKSGQVLVDLGSGDGSLLVAAARRGIKAVGYEINPFLWVYSYLRSWRYRSLVSIKLRSFWRADLSDADGVFVFLITRYMLRFDRSIKAGKGNKPLKVVSHAFTIPGKKPAQKLGPLFLYIYK